MTRNYRLTLLALLFVCLPVAPAKAQPAAAGSTMAADDERLARILQQAQRRLDEARAAAQFPGATVGFVLPDGRAGSVSTGVADVETKRPLRPADRMLAGSIGKTFVAAVTLLLVQDGRLKLDEKIARWLDQEKWFGRLPNAPDITLRMLLNHSSGIRNHVEQKGFLDAIFKHSARDIRYEELLAYVLDKKPLFPAGRGYNYADTNYILIGLIVERATGRTLYDEIAERILRPLKLDRTIPANSRTLPEVANGYLANKPVIVGGKFIANPQWEWAGGGFASTAEDLARWAWALYGGDVLQKDSLAEMLHSTTTGEGADYGLGAMIVKSKWGKCYGHDGEFPGYLSDMRYFPSYRIAVAVMVNSDETPGVNKFLATAVDDFAQIIVKEISDRELTAADQLKLRQSAESWLRLIDAGRFAASWTELSAELKAKYAQEQWQSALQPLLRQVGKLKTRRFQSVNYADPEAATVAVDFASSFTKVAAAAETVILKLEQDGHWHVASYSIH